MSCDTGAGQASSDQVAPETSKNGATLVTAAGGSAAALFNLATKVLSTEGRKQFMDIIRDMQLVNKAALAPPLQGGPSPAQTIPAWLVERVRTLFETDAASGLLLDAFLEFLEGLLGNLEVFGWVFEILNVPRFN